MESKLIVAVSSRPELYDRSAYYYRDKKRRILAWQEISEEVGEEEDVCRSKWKNLRDTYAREKKKERKRKLDEQPDNKHQWRFLSALAFLSPFLSAREGAEPEERAKTADAKTQVSTTPPPHAASSDSQTPIPDPSTAATPTQTSATPPQTSPTLPQTSPTLPQTSPTLPQTSATLPQTSATPPQTSTAPPQTSTAPPQTSATSPQTSSMPKQPSATPPHTSSTPPQSSATPPQTSATSQTSDPLPQISSTSRTSGPVPRISCTQRTSATPRISSTQQTSATPRISSTRRVSATSSTQQSRRGPKAPAARRTPVSEFVKMSKGQRLRVLVNERLAAAAEDIILLFERTVAEYEEEMSRSKEENHKKQQILDQLLMPRIEQVMGNFQFPSTRPDASLNQERCPMEPEEQSFVKQEEEHLPVCVPESSAVYVKTKGSSLLQQRQSEQREETQGENRRSEPHVHSETVMGHIEQLSDTDNDDDREPSICSTAQMEMEADGEHNNPVQSRDRSTEESSLNTSAPQTIVNNKDRSERAQKKHQCPVCYKRFTKKKNLKRHVRVHTKGDTDGKSFISSATHQNKCSVSKKRFTSKQLLKRHLRVHKERDKTFRYSVCGQKFTTKSHLVKHKRTHSRKKPYSCSVCEKTFRCKGVFNVHMRTHTGDSFYCTLCQKEFIVKSNFRRHNLMHIKSLHVNLSSRGIKEHAKKNLIAV